jgi:hypothetical protein
MDRRSLLTRLPLFGAAVVLPTSPLASVGTIENPDLVALAATLVRHRADYAAALITKCAARARYDAVVSVPDSILIQRRTDQQFYGNGEPLYDGT